jgi:16S rRNA (cytosine967-C5)-methyltransferase
MAISPARSAAFDILLRVEKESSYASDLLHSQPWSSLSGLDHGLATELVMGVLRWQSWIDAKIQNHASQPMKKMDAEVVVTLRLGAYQLFFLERVPQHAAVHESVELVKRARKTSAGSFVNAVLRKLAIDSEKEGSPETGIVTAKTAPELAIASAHPEWMVRRWMERYGLEAASAICRYDQQRPATTVWFRRPEAKSELESQGIRFMPGKLLSSAYEVDASGITQIQALRNHAVSIQDEGSQLVAKLVGAGNKILDCCAAPGGKTLLLADTNPSARVVAVELHKHRAQALMERVKGTQIDVVTDDIANLPGSAGFDRVLADVPCSGTGTLSRNPEIKWRLRPDDFVRLQATQRTILESAMRHVASGGRLVYSTCSLEPEEAEQVVEFALARNSSFQLLDCCPELERLQREGLLAWADISSLLAGPFLRTLPGIHPCDGFFAAILERKSTG